VVETFKGPAGDIATVQIPIRLRTACGLDLPAVGAQLLVALDPGNDSAWVPFKASYAELLREYKSKLPSGEKTRGTAHYPRTPAWVRRRNGVSRPTRRRPPRFSSPAQRPMRRRFSSALTAPAVIGKTAAWFAWRQCCAPEVLTSSGSTSSTGKKAPAGPIRCHA